MRKSALLLLALLAASAFTFSLPGALKEAAAEPTGSWTTTTAYPFDIGGNACVTTSSPNIIPGPYYAMYCTMGQLAFPGTTHESYYAVMLDGGLANSWIETTPSIASYNTGIPQCTAWEAVMFCGTSQGGATEWAPLTVSGIGTWSLGPEFPNTYTSEFGGPPDNTCQTYQGYFYCLGQTSAPAGPVVFTDSINAAGPGPGMTNAGYVSGSNLQFQGMSCQVVQASGGNAYLVCLGGYYQPSGSGSNDVWEAAINNGLVGTWFAGTPYPITPPSGYTLTCWSAFSGYINCLGGHTTNAYVGTVTSSGTISWTSTTYYTTNQWSYQSCSGFTSVGTDYVFCSPGLNQVTGGGATSETFYTTSSAATGATFTAVITNMDAGNYLTTGGKYYDFRATVSSNAISGVNAAITNVTLIFNDSVHIFVISYNNDTKTFAQNPSSLPYVILSPGNVTSSYNQQVRLIVVNFLVSLSTSVVPASNRDLTLYGLNANLLSKIEVVQEAYYNILNPSGGGGTISITEAGLCSVPAGADTFQTQCTYQAAPKSSIRENATYYDLQQYQGLFSIQLSDGSPLQGDAYLWQNYANSGSGSNNSTNPGDWTITMGLYYFDNSSGYWVKGLNAEISTLVGRQGSANQWTEFNVEWRNGATFIKNQTVVDWIQQTPLGEATIWVNFWYSQNNSSTSQGGQVSSYYTGMKDTGFLWWSSWSPLLQNYTVAEAFAPLLNHAGGLMSSTQAQYTKVFYNMARPGANGVHSKQPNFQSATQAFQIQSFGTTQGGPMGGIDTPAFAPAVVPIIQNTGFFSPIIKGLQALATWIATALTAVGTATWAGLGSRFPWFTDTLSAFTSTIISFYSFMIYGIIYVGDFVRFAYSVIGLVLYPIKAIISAWGIIQGIYTPIFGGANLSAIITIAVLWVFAGAIIDLADKNDTKGFIALATGAWHIVKAAFDITWMIAKFLVDSVEGLIP